MAFRVETTLVAQSDAQDILERLLAEGAGETGIRWFLALEDAIASLATFPRRCTLAPESKEFPFEVRQLLYGSKLRAYRILFTIEDATVYVLHIRPRQAKDPLLALGRDLRKVFCKHNSRRHAPYQIRSAAASCRAVKS